MIKILIYIIALIFLLVLSAFFSSSETAYLSITKIQLRQMIKTKKPNAKKVEKLKNDIDNLLTTILIGNNFVNSLASSLATALAISLVGKSGTAIATFFMSIFLIIFGEVLPKTIATYHSEKLASIFSIPLLWIKFLLTPFTKVFSFILKTLNKIETDASPVITEDELKTLIDVGNQEGTLESSERSMLKKIFNFTDLRLRDIMTHRSLITGIQINATFEQTVNLFSKSGFSRLAVYSDSPETIVGIIHYKDVLHFKDKNSNFNLKDIMFSPVFVPETKTAVALLHLFKTDKQNIAITIDEHGSVAGIVTMDDILKAIFGRIADEYNKETISPEERIEILNHSQYRLPGDTPLTTVNEVFHLQLESEDFETLGGWLLEQFGSLPVSGEALKRGNIIYTVEDQSRRQITSVRMSFI